MKISSKITGICLAIVGLSTLTFLATIIVQRGPLSARIDSLVHEQAHDQTGKVVQAVYYNCASTEAQYQSRLTHDLALAREILARTGQAAFDPKSVEWIAVNQLTGQRTPIQLPRLLMGKMWLGQNTATNRPSPVVDDVRHLTRDHCTIFQRMNDDGDMLRVDTSIVAANGDRAVGTFIPHQNDDGSANKVIATVLKGETFRGRAFVVNDYHEAAYEPIWDAAKSRVIGMLYVGVSVAEFGKDFHDAITKILVGKSGYVYVLDSKGKYIVSRHGERDGENILDSKDANGQYFIQSIVDKARKTSDGSLANEFYSWKNPGDPAPREKFAALTYYAPWDWVIAAGVYEDDAEVITDQVEQAMSNLVKWSSLTALCIGLIAFVASYRLSMGLTRPITKIVGYLNTGTQETVMAAGQVSTASQSLAAGASEQAASLEETSSSLEEMSSMTKRNAENALKANGLAKQARSAADQGVADMREMDQAMGAIKESSDDIAKIIKTIDEIAFQTNILALNAAVEAARAGEAGMGFAVVADEVRNLAQRSAHAAKETAGKIESAITKTGRGVEISGKVAKTLNDIVAKIHQVDELVAEVSSASTEQTQGITQINTAINQIDKVTQSNAANAEQSAAAAQELNAQSEFMRGSVVELSNMVTGNIRRAAHDQNSSTTANGGSAVRFPANPTHGYGAKTIDALPAAFN